VPEGHQEAVSLEELGVGSGLELGAGPVELVDLRVVGGEGC